MTMNKEKIKGIVPWLLCGVLTFALCLTLLPEKKQEGVGAVGAMGWVDDKVERGAFAPLIQLFSDTPAFKNFQGEEPKFVYSWKNYEAIHGKPRPERNQGQVGICTGFGSAGAAETTLCNDIVTGVISDDFKEIACESLYALARVEPSIGGGRIRGDGAVGAWIAKAMTDFGFLWRQQYPSYDLSVYSETRGKEWGYTGLPPSLKSEAAKFVIKDVANVSSWKEFKKAAANGYGVFVCSNQGFSSDRDGNGVAQPRGTWNHCMYIDGYHVDLGTGKEYGHIDNSWGPNFFKGPTGWGNPSRSGFWADSVVIDRMLRQNDSYAVAGIKGFPVRKLIWKDGVVVRPVKVREFARSRPNPFLKEFPCSLAF